MLEWIYLTCSFLPPVTVSGRGNNFGSVRVVVCLSVCVCLRSTGWTVGPKDLKFGARIKDHHTLDNFEGQGHRSKVKVTKVKNVKIPVFSKVSEKVVQGQGHKSQGQGHKGQSRRSRSQGQSCSDSFVPPSISREVRHAGVFITWKMWICQFSHFYFSFLWH